MNSKIVSCFGLIALLFLSSFGASSVLAQSDEIVVTPNRGSSDICGFKIAVKNKNAALTPIDELKLEITSLNGTVFTDAAAPFKPAQWTSAYTDLVDSFFAVVNPIAPGATLGGFGFAYTNNGTAEFDNPVSITWTTLNQGNVISTGTINPICVSFQYFNKYDTVVSSSSMNGTDPCFNFTAINRNDLSADIYYLRFQLLSLNSGTLRPSKITPPAGWTLDSVNAYNAYFHTDQNPVVPGSPVSPFAICLRANTTVTKHNFAWHAFDQQHYLIDRDTLMNLPGTATGAPDNADEISAAAVSGCLYQASVKNYHVSNVLQPSKITKIILKSQTPGVKFDAAPSAPLHWTKVFNPDSIIYAADSSQNGIPSGTISNAIRFSVTGTTTTDFTIGWQTFRPAGLLSSGQFTTKCTVESPRKDSAFISPGTSECNFKLTVGNKHNTPPSDLSEITISIPDNTGQIVGNSSSSAWNFTNVSPRSVKFTSVSTLQSTGQSQDLNFTFVPKTPGQAVDLTWSTFDQSGPNAVSTGKIPISCTPVVTTCDTVWKNAVDIDSCTYEFTVQNRNTATITLLTLTPTKSWTIDSVGKTPGWSTQLDGGHSTVQFSNDAGLPAGQILKGFGTKFIGYNTTDSFEVIAVTHDLNNKTCTTIIPMFCSSRFKDTASVHGDPTLDPKGLANLVIVPNPTRLMTKLLFDVRSQQRVTITVYDVLGNTVSSITNQIYAPGSYEFPIRLNEQSSGNYYIRIETPYGLVTKRVIKE